MNQLIWFDSLFTMGGVFSGWFYRCGSRMYDEDVEVQLVTYETTPLTLVCSVWDSVQIYTACFLHLHVFSCHQIKCTQGQMFMRHMPLRSYRIINWCCPNYDIWMLGNYFVSGIPLWKGPPLNSWVFFGSAANQLQPMQPTGLGSSTIEDTIKDPEAETGGGMTGGSSRSAWNRGFRMQFWWCILMYFDVFCYFVIYLSFGLQRELARSDQLLRWWDNGLGWVIREGGTLYNSAFMIEYRPQKSKTGNARAVGIVLLQLHNMIWYV